MGDRKIHWRCFHCGDTFTKAQARWAREHFGASELETSACLMRVPGEGSLLSALRNAQDELARRRAEDSDLMRALYSMQADHAQALRREEERGYEKGIRDARGVKPISPRALAVLDKIAWLAAEEDSWFGNENDIAVQRAAAERHRAALSKTEKKGDN